MHRPRALAAVVVDSDPLVSSLPASATGRGNVSAAGVYEVMVLVCSGMERAVLETRNAAKHMCARNPLGMVRVAHGAQAATARLARRALQAGRVRGSTVAPMANQTTAVRNAQVVLAWAPRQVAGNELGSRDSVLQKERSGSDKFVGQRLDSTLLHRNTVRIDAHTLKQTKDTERCRARLYERIKRRGLHLNPDFHVGGRFNANVGGRNCELDDGAMRFGWKFARSVIAERIAGQSATGLARKCGAHRRDGDVIGDNAN